MVAMSSDSACRCPPESLLTSALRRSSRPMPRRASWVAHDLAPLVRDAAAQPAAMRAQERQRQVLLDRHRRRGAGARVLEDAPDRRGCARTRLPGHIAPAEHDRARREREGAGNGVEQRRLAGPVGADDGDELAGGDLEVDAAQSDDLVGGAGEEHLAQDAQTPSGAGRSRRTTLLRTVGIESATTTRAAVSSLRSVGAMPRRRLTAMSSR